MAGVEFQHAAATLGQRPIVRNQNQRTADAAVQFEQEVGDFLSRCRV
jgi:hypothetical protein